MRRGKLLVAAVGIALGLVVGNGTFQRVHAAEPTGAFNLQVTPSPLVTTVKPGQKTQVELRIRNGSTDTENLKIETRSFSYNSASGQVNLNDTAAPAVAAWVSFSQPKFTIQSGQWFSEQVVFNVPKDAGFSYSFALVISRQSDPKPTNAGRLIKGSLAVFSLINIDRPGAKSSLQVVQFTSSKRLYEYLPATLSIRFHNDGNTIVQPYGNLFIQRGATSKKPLAALVVNENKGYILPGTARTVTASWNDGFATYQTTAQADGSSKRHLNIDWSKLSHFRIGRYTAKLVAVYSDGQHDVPIEGSVTFWVVPWRAIIGFIILITGLWFFARWRSKRRTEKAVKRALAIQAATKQKTEEKQS